MWSVEDTGSLHEALERMVRGEGRGSGPLGQEEIRGWHMSNAGLVLGADTLSHVAMGGAFPGGRASLRAFVLKRQRCRKGGGR